MAAVRLDENTSKNTSRKMPGRIVIILSVLLVVAAELLLEPKPLRGIRGQNLTVTCSFPDGTLVIVLVLRGEDITTIGSKFLGVKLINENTAEYRYGPLEVSDDEAVFVCDDSAGNMDSANLKILGKRTIINTEYVYSMHACQIILLLL